jgi:serine-aspartate repeat-containing protein C/D/E
MLFHEKIGLFLKNSSDPFFIKEVVVNLISNAIKRLYNFRPARPSKRNSRPWRWHKCRVEQMESRQLLSATAQIHLGAVFVEIGKGDDLTGDAFEITFSGGADGTKLTDLTINLKTGSSADKYCFFDTQSGDKGVFGASPFALVGTNTIGLDTNNVEISDSGTTLTLHFTNFTAGEKLVFTVDVDEQDGSDATALTEGAEFSRQSSISATFKADHYVDKITDAIAYVDYYTDDDATALGLPNDDYTDDKISGVQNDSETGPIDTAGAFATVEQTPLPVTLSGYVYLDANQDNNFDTSESGIAGVTLTLYSLVEGGYVSTGKTTVTDADGHYSFGDLTPDTYRVVETQPSGYYSVGSSPGTVGGATVGSSTTADILSGIALQGGDDSINNDFGEAVPASVSGYVYYDANNNGVYDSGDSAISGVTVTLLDADGNPTGSTAVTDTIGYYEFSGLAPGAYSVSETQPAGYLEGAATAGSVGGTVENADLISSITLDGGVNATDYDFGEILPAGISGKVFADSNNNNQYDSGEPLLSGVTIYLLDQSKTRVALTQTDENGEYYFTDLAPGTYGVEEVQPVGYFEGADYVGSEGGSLDGVDRIIDAKLGPGVYGTEYNFSEILPAAISGYVFQDGPAIEVKKGDPTPDITSLRDGALTSDDTRLAGVQLQLCDGSGYPLLDGDGNYITTVTDADGYYQFTGLEPGDYSVIAKIPDGYVDGIDTAGSKGGVVVNAYATIDPSLLSTLAVDTQDNAIVKIALNSGDAAVQYNFSVVKMETPPDGPIVYPNPVPPAPSPPSMPIAPDYFRYGVSYVLPPIVMPMELTGGSGGPPGCTWHLSVINGGQPRQLENGQFAADGQTQLFDPDKWTGADLNQGGTWIIADSNGAPVKKYHFGLRGATPVTGDWNGDGVTKIGVFIDGLWFLDLNGDGVWDELDLWAKLGQQGDQPVSGDWDGDGKTDIGIFGPAWFGDPRAVLADPGLPDAQNPIKNGYKNVPPEPEDATIGYRTMKRTSAGNIRSDLIDHVFRFGADGDKAVVGDWNGDGIRSIGIFRNGTWFLDMNGDGRWGPGDLVREFGQEGDIPVVGDWTGDGISKIGVYRNGTFYLDTNNNHVLDATDKVFSLGSPGDKPFAGDFTGGGVDTVGVYHDGGGNAETVSAPQSVPTPAPVPAGK